MIYDHITNASKYYCLNKNFQTAFNYITTTNLQQLTEGKQIIDGDNCFAIVNRYKTKLIKDSFAESHRKYIDIQFMVSGSEKIGFGHIHNFNTGDYIEESDLQKHEGELDFVTLTDSHFTILFPDDVHMPGIINNIQSEVLKIVVKVAV